MPKICIFDASGYLFRAYHALPPLTNKKGEPVGAIFGFYRMVSKIVNTEKPDYVAVCFDTPEPTFRHEEYEDYKANRDEPDNDIIVQIPVAEELVEKWGLPSLKKPGFEADDVMATVARAASEKDVDVFIYSGDKDILQLVNKNIRVRDDMRKKDYGEPEVVERYGIGPKLVVDMLSLMGDKIDNVIGIPGVGEKTATKLLSQYGSMEGIYENLDGVKESLKEKLLKYKDKVFKNRTLIKLREDVLPVDIESLKVRQPDPKEFPALLQRLDFRTDYKPVSAPPVPQALVNKNRKVHTILDEAQLNLCEAAFLKSSRISYDLETDSLNSHTCNIVGVALSHEENEAWYIPVGHSYLGVPNQLPWEKVNRTLQKLLSRKDVVKLGQNLKFDNTILSRFGVEVQGPFFDTMIAAYCLYPERSTFGLKDLAREFLAEEMVRFEELLSVGKKKTIEEVEIDKSASYAGADAEVVLRLAKLLEKRIKEGTAGPLFYEMEMPLVQVIQKMEKSGFTIDTKYLKSVGDRFRVDMMKIEKEVFKQAGEEFKLSSPKQLSRILFEKLKLPPVKKTKTGYSTNESVLSKLAEKHPICSHILKFRELAKLTSTYVDSLIDLVDPNTNKVHTSFNQTGTSTGRLSSTTPNLQNIPIRTEHGREIRKAFIASEGRTLISADYSQVDLRSLAHMSKDPALVKAFKDGGDIHARTAAEVFHVSLDKVDKDMRRKAKAINFGVVYGQQAWALSQSLELSVEEAQEFINNYFKTYAGVKSWIDETLNTARKTGYVTTLSGRTRKVPDINSSNANFRGFAERIAMNTPIQGTSADIIKAAMIKVDDIISGKNFKTTMPVQVHDELLFDVPENEISDILPIVKAAMEGAYTLEVPLVVDIKTGKNWNDMEPVQ